MGNLSTEDKIVSAAREEFCSKGFDGTRMRSIAERAEINKGLLHYYFKTKEALLLHVFQDTFRSLFDSIEGVKFQNQDLAHMIHEMVSVLMNFHSSKPQLSRFLIMEMNRDPQRHINRMKRIGLNPPIDHLEEAIEKAKMDGLIREDVSVEQLVLNMISMIMFPMVAKPMVKFMLTLDEPQYKQLLKQRNEEISTFIVNSIKVK